MWRIIPYFFLIFGGPILPVSVNAQTSTADLVQKVFKVISDNIVNERIKDSTAVYSTVLTINLEAKENKQQVECFVADKEVESFFIELDQLKKIDYRSLLSYQKKRSLLVKIYILVTDSKYKQQQVAVENIWAMLNKTTRKDEFKALNLGNIILKFDKKTY